MSTKRTVKMLKAYMPLAASTLFLSGFFQAPAENFHQSEEVEIDIQRSDEDIAIAIQDVSAGYNMNAEDLYTNKGFKPPIFKEAVSLNAFSLLQRFPGDNPFADVGFRLKLAKRFFSGMQKVEKKIRRSIELQASQILQTGKVDLRNEAGVVVYTIDYKPKASHFPTASVIWGQPGADYYGDINALVEQVRDDGLEDPDQLLFGAAAFEAAIKDDEFMKRFEARRADLGTISPMKIDGQGGQYRGTFELGTYKLDIWTYGGRFVDPATKAKKSYLDGGSVVVRSSTGRMDATFGAIPNFNDILGGTPILPEIPRRFPLNGKSIDLHTNVFKSVDGDQLVGGVGTRPLLIPTAIDTFGCLTTGL
jgi:hypothetical protein